MHIAAQNGHSSVVEILIKCGADVNAVDVVSCFWQAITTYSAQHVFGWFINSSIVLDMPLLMAHIIMVNPAAKSLAIANQNQAVAHEEMHIVNPHTV